MMQQEQMIDRSSADDVELTSRNLFLGSIRSTAFRSTSVGSLSNCSSTVLSFRPPTYLHMETQASGQVAKE